MTLFIVQASCGGGFLPVTEVEGSSFTHSATGMRGYEGEGMEEDETNYSPCGEAETSPDFQRKGGIGRMQFPAEQRGDAEKMRRE